jgi:phosphate transport system permease protein
MNKIAPDLAWHHRRLRAEKRFRLYGRCALAMAVLMLVLLLGGLTARGYQGFVQTQIRLPITFDAGLLGVESGMDVTVLSPSTYLRLVKASLRSSFPEVTDRITLKKLYELVSISNGMRLKKMLEEDRQLLSKTVDVWLPASSIADLYIKGVISEKTPELQRNVSNQQIGWLKHLQEQQAVRTVFNKTFFTHGDSRTPEQAGFLGAMMGSALTLLICLLVVFPLGVMTAVYLEEFAHPGKWVDLIEVNINNLAAVPSIVFGLLGLAVYINVMGLPRSSALVGGATLAMTVLPVIIITTRVALSSIPGAIRDAALALGATPLQVLWHHTLPLAMPGIMTGTILGMARAIGETAPLLLIGMVAFVVDLPTGVASSATVMPVQIYLWASSPEAGFAEKTAAGILVLLVLLLAMNALAIILRKRFEVRW